MRPRGKTGSRAITGNVTVSGISGNYLYLGDSSTNNGTLVIQNGANFSVTGTLEEAYLALTKEQTEYETEMPR